jgi:hypothetical protein
VTRSTSTTMKAFAYHGPEKYAREDKLWPVIQDVEKLWDRNISLTQRLVDTSTTPMPQRLSIKSPDEGTDSAIGLPLGRRSTVHFIRSLSYCMAGT